MKLPKIQFKFEPTLQDMSEQFICARCKKNFPQDELKAPPLFLQILAFPLYLKSFQTAKEAHSKYCPMCRRSVNASLFFVAFIITVIVVFLVIKKFSNN